MKNRFIRMFLVICAVILTICAVSVWACAEEAVATSTDLKPADSAGAEETEEEIADSLEIIITKAVQIGETWSGPMKKTKPAVLKLDVDYPQQINVLVTGKDIWVSVEKSDRVTENPARILTDEQTNQAVISWFAEAGSYLITVGPVEPNLMGKAQVVIMDNEAFAAWEAEQAAQEVPAEEPGEEPEAVEENPEGELKEDPAEEMAEEPAEEPDGEQIEPSEEKEDIPTEERSINIIVTCDSPNPVIGDTAHFEAVLDGYEELKYSIQWQYSPDHDQWFDIPQATELCMDVVTNRENNYYYWRIVIYIEDEQEG